jgi:hypothetical protein
MKTSVLVLGVATLASTIASAHLWQTLRQERAQSAALQARVADLEERLIAAVALPPPKTIGSQLPEPTVEPEPASPPQQVSAVIRSTPMNELTSTAPPDAEMQRRFRAGREEQLRLLKDPEYRALMRDQQKLAMQQAHADLDLFLDLTPEEADRLFDVLAEQALRNMEQRPPIAEFSGAPPSEADMLEWRQKMEEQRRQNEMEIAAVLGSKYNDWQEYQRNGWSRSQVAQLRQALSLTNEPLRQDQIKPLAEAIAREQRNLSRPRNMPSPRSLQDPQASLRFAEEMLERTAETHRRIRDAVSGLLTPTQLAQLKRQQEQELKAQELALRQQRARVERGEPIPGFRALPGTVMAYP